MAKTIVCSVGTSAGKGLGPPKDLATWVAEQGGVENAARTMFARFADVPPEGERLRTTLSAEVHSLVRIGVSAGDRVILLASETDDGLACAKALEHYLSSYFGGILIHVEPVPGLQVQNAERFRREGVVQFVRRCLEAITSFGSAHVILNPTGGFKALVPYTVLVGMVKRVPCHYIFEQSAELIELPPLPVTFDRAPFDRYNKLIARIERESKIPLDHWHSEVQHEDLSWLEPMIEHNGADITLSAVGLLLLDEVRTPTALIPFLSRQALTDCLDNLCRLDVCEPFRFLDRMASAPEMLTEKTHIKMDHGLFWLKPGRTTDRYLVSVADWRLLVWRAIREDEVGPNYPQQVVVDPRRDRKRYGPFIRMEFAQES